jgi:two-component system NarL family sensor kinase
MERIHQSSDRTCADLASRVHDRIGQNLAALRFLLTSNSEPGTILALVDSTIAETRTLERDVFPLLPILGLRPALESLAERIESDYGLAVLLIADANIELEENQACALVRNARELLENAGRHAGATSASVQLEHSDLGTVLCVEDDGVGFDTERPLRRDQLGLFGVGEEMRALGGELLLVSTVGRGTRATLVLKPGP